MTGIFGKHKFNLQLRTLGQNISTFIRFFHSYKMPFLLYYNSKKYLVIRHVNVPIGIFGDIDVKQAKCYKCQI